MDDRDVDWLVALLGKLKAEGLAAPKMPRAVWQALHGLVLQPAVEIIVSRTGWDFLLTYRQDEAWKGWHIPGGFMGCGESVGASCQRIARQEVGADVIFEELVDAYVWPDHPYASALSLVCSCRARTAPVTGTFFTSSPPDMVPHHADFIAAFLAMQRTRSRVRLEEPGRC